MQKFNFVLCRIILGIGENAQKLCKIPKHMLYKNCHKIFEENMTQLLCGQLNLIEMYQSAPCGRNCSMFIIEQFLSLA